MAHNGHWTAESNAAFVHRISADFLAQVEKRMEAIPITQGALARKLGVSEGAVSQILNNPQNLTLKTVVAYARALGIKVSLVAYDDNDPLNERGPVNSEIFSVCWENAGKPSDFWSLQESLRVVNTEQTGHVPGSPEGKTIAPAVIGVVQKIGIQRFDSANNLTVDAAAVNPLKRKNAKTLRIQGESEKRKFRVE